MTYGRSFVVKCRNIMKEPHPPPWKTCKVLRPWALFHKTTVKSRLLTLTSKKIRFQGWCIEYGSRLLRPTLHPPDNIQVYAFNSPSRMSIPLHQGRLLGSPGPSHLLANPLPYHCLFNTKDVRTALSKVLQV